MIMNVIGVGRCSIRDRSKSCPPDLAGLSTVMFGTLRRPRGFAIVSKDSDSDCAERSVLESDPPANPHLKRTEMWGTQIGGQMWATRRCFTAPKARPYLSPGRWGGELGPPADVLCPLGWEGLGSLIGTDRGLQEGAEKVLL